VKSTSTCNQLSHAKRRYIRVAVECEIQDDKSGAIHGKRDGGVVMIRPLWRQAVKNRCIDSEDKA
jgi:hypothetical protein